MRIRRVSGLLVICIILTGCLTISAGAIGVGTSEYNTLVARASGRFNMDIPGNDFFTAETSLPLEAGETVTISAVYSPRFANIDFGLIAPDGLFYSVGAKNGGFDETIEVDQKGNYTLAIRNNSDCDVSISGFVTY